MSDQDTRQRIIEASTYLFGVKGYDATSTREIAQRAGVNIASLNYHFKSKQGILEEVTGCIIVEFKEKMKALAQDPNQSAAQYALKIYGALHDDQVKCLNHFKMFLGSGNSCSHLMEGDQPPGWDELRRFIRKEINPTVPDSETLWASSIIFSYLMHSAVMGASDVGKLHINKFLPQGEDTIPSYLKQLVETLIRDLNNRYSK